MDNDQKQGQDTLKSSKTVKFLLGELIGKHAPKHAFLLRQIVESESTYLADNSKIAQDKVEQLVLNFLKRDSDA